MAIYRPPASRWRFAVLAAIAGIIAGFVLGAVLLREEPDPVETMRRLKADTTTSVAVLDVLTVEYAEAVEDGDVVRRAEYRGALDALERFRRNFDEVRPALLVLDTDAVHAADEAADDLEELMSEHASDVRVRRAARELKETVVAIVGA